MLSFEPASKSTMELERTSLVIVTEWAGGGGGFFGGGLAGPHGGSAQSASVASPTFSDAVETVHATSGTAASARRGLSEDARDRIRFEIIAPPPGRRAEGARADDPKVTIRPTKSP